MTILTIMTVKSQFQYFSIQIIKVSSVKTTVISFNTIFICFKLQSIAVKNFNDEIKILGVLLKQSDLLQQTVIADDYKFINHRRMSRMLKQPKSIGKLSSRKLSLFEQTKDKKISAVLPRMSEKPISRRISHSALLAEGKQDPLPHIKAGMKPLKAKAKSARNPEEEVFYVDGSRKKIGHCIAVQMSSPRHSQAGKFYNPSAQILASPGRIRHQNSSEISSKPALQTTIQNLKNFLQHKYVQEMQQKRKGITLMEYDRRFGESVSSSANFDKPRYQPEEEVFLACSQSQAKPFYLSTSFVKMNGIFLKDDGPSFAPCNRDEIAANYMEQENENSGQAYHLLLASTSSHITIEISLLTSISKIKQILIEEDNNLHLSFAVPSYLRAPLKHLGSQQEIHRATQEVFQEMAQFRPQLVSLKKFANCILLVAKSPHSSQSYALMWHYNGSFYFGGWQVNKGNEGFKVGVGLQYVAKESIYFGEFASNQRQGYGALKKGNGETYVGEWKEGQREGWGKLFESSGFLSLDGNFENDCFTGNRVESRMIVA